MLVTYTHETMYFIFYVEAYEYQINVVFRLY